MSVSLALCDSDPGFPSKVPRRTRSGTPLLEQDPASTCRIDQCASWSPGVFVSAENAGVSVMRPF